MMEVASLKSILLEREEELVELEMEVEALKGLLLERDEELVRLREENKGKHSLIASLKAQLKRTLELAVPSSPCPSFGDTTTSSLGSSSAVSSTKQTAPKKYFSCVPEEVKMTFPYATSHRPSLRQCGGSSRKLGKKKVNSCGCSCGPRSGGLEEETPDHDLTTAKNNELQSATAQLKHFAMMTHEIRTPLNCIIGLSSLMLDDVKTTRSSTVQKDFRSNMRMIVQSGDLLLNVVNDILDYSRLESGHVEINLEPTEIRSVLDLVVHSIGVKARGRKIQIRQTVDPNLYTSIKMDGSRLQQILYNLLGNATKFSKKGGVIDFSVQVVKRDTQSDLLLDGDIPCPSTGVVDKIIQFRVKDYGKGIAEEDLVGIFEPFNQGASGTARDYGGTGLGLAVTSKLVKCLGGTISVNSQLGEYAEFVVNLPCIQAEPATIVVSTAADTRKQEFGCDSPCGNTTDMTEQEPPPRVLTRKSILFKDDRDSLGSLSTLFNASTSCSSTCMMSDEELWNDSVNSSSLLLNMATDMTTAPTKAEHHAEEQAATSHEGLRILLADDNCVNCKVLERMLHRVVGAVTGRGVLRIDTARNGQEACDLESQNTYDLVLMDMQMPVLDGLSACRKMLNRHRCCSNNNNNRKPPNVVFVTAHAMDTYRDQAREAGGSGFLAKPFNLKKLKSVIHSLLEQEDAVV